MFRTSSPHTSRLSRDAQRLIRLAQALSLSGSRLEDLYWENKLGALLEKTLQTKKGRTVESALDELLSADINAYEILVEQAETHSESLGLSFEDQDYDVLLFAAPIVAWTRYQLPARYPLDKSAEAVANQLRTHILASGTRLALLDELVCFDQMPQTFQEARAWTRSLGMMALGRRTDSCELHPMPNSEGMLADARFVVGAIVAPKGAPLFRWQDDADAPISRAQCLQDWITGITPVLGPLFTGCSIEYLQPDAYYISSRDADRRIRPQALRAAVTWLQNVAHLQGGDLKATIAACGEQVVEEYRVGFTTRSSTDVIYGSIWPILSKEEAVADSINAERADVPDEIAALLNELGVTDVRRLSGLYPMEFCDDCGAPFFPNPLGEMMHPELPEELDLNPVHLH